jgi:hypothetical protein
VPEPASEEMSIDLGYCQGVIYFDAQVPDRAFDLGMPEQELDGSEISCPSIDQGSFCASQ